MSEIYGASTFIIKAAVGSFKTVKMVMNFSVAYVKELLTQSMLKLPAIAQIQC